MITLIDRSRVTLRDGILSESTLTEILDTIAQGKNILIYINRRGAHRAFVCSDCSYIAMCPRCDISLTLHTSPRTELLCHHCGYKSPVPSECPKCHGVNIKWVGMAIQSVENFCTRIFKNVAVIRLDSDVRKWKKDTVLGNTSGAIYLSTSYALRHLQNEVSLCIVLIPEAELAVPEYDIEERVYTHVRALASLADTLVIETHAPKLALLQDLLHGNYRDWLARTLRERKSYRYPPYTGLAYIEVAHKSAGTVEDIVAKLANKLWLESKVTGSEILYDRKARMRRADLTIDTLVIRGPDIRSILEPIKWEILKNRSVRLDIRGEKIL